MTPAPAPALDTAFALVDALPLVGWAALLLAPLRRAPLIAVARACAVAVAVGYVLMIAATLGRPGPPVDLSSLAGLAHAFSDPRVMLVGWAHYLALDLWTGAWEAEEAHRAGTPHWALVPALVLTFLAGPAGLLLFLGLRAGFGRRRRSLSAA